MAMPRTKKRDRDIKKEAQIKSYLEALPAYCAEYMTWVGDSRASETRFAYLFDLKQFMTYLVVQKEGTLSADAYMEFQATRFSSVTSDDVSDFLDSLAVTDPATGKETEISPSYRERKIAALQLFFSFLKEKHVTDSSPVDVLSRPTPDSSSSVLTDEQIKTLIDGIRGNDQYLIWSRTPEGGLTHEVCDIAPEARLRRERSISRNIALISCCMPDSA